VGKLRQKSGSESGTGRILDAG